jgi:DMSO reductase anchor subunit
MNASAWSRAIRRGILPIALGVVCWIVSIPATEDLDPLLKWLGLIFVVLGLVTIVASARTYAADERVLARGPGRES